MGARFEPGELVDVSIKGARVSDRHVQDKHLFLYVGEESFSLPLRMLDRANVTRIAPAEWPPQIGDVWTDRFGSTWFAFKPVGFRRDDQPAVVMQPEDPTRHTPIEPDEALRLAGPMTLAHRKGWTPAPAECACGVTYAGFDTHAEAVAMLDAHILEAGRDRDPALETDPAEVWCGCLTTQLAPGEKFCAGCLAAQQRLKDEGWTDAAERMAKGLAPNADGDLIAPDEAV